jgi:hypothetical protein
MKKQILIAALLLALGLGTAAAQTPAPQTDTPKTDTPPKFWVMATAGTRGGGSFKIQSEELAYNTIQLSNGFAYGLSFGYRVTPSLAFEAMWSRLNTSVSGTASGEPPVDETLFDASEDQFHANLLLSTGYMIGSTRPYFLLGVGVTSINPQAEASTITHFSWGLGFGIEAMLKGQLGLRAQGKFTPTYVNTTDEIMQEWNGGAETTAIRNTMTQWEFQAGLFFRF